jgi:hypothetical protein
MTSQSDLISVVIRFNDALNARYVDAMMQWMTPDCVFENTFPPPDGTRYEGQAAVRAFWEDFFRSAGEVHIETEAIFAVDTHCIMRWRYHWVDRSGQPGHIRGVDIYQIENGLIAEKLSYVKG